MARVFRWMCAVLLSTVFIALVTGEEQKDAATSRGDFEAVELGRRLFFDRRLSIDNSVSCADCHDPNKGWADGRRVSIGVNKLRSGRNAPSIVNAGSNKFLLWDGRAKTLEQQALLPLIDPVEMGNESVHDVLDRLARIPSYRSRFASAFEDGATVENLAAALAAYQRQIVSRDTPYDRFHAGEKDALSEGAQRGMHLFFVRAHCGACHPGPSFTDDAFANVKVGIDPPSADPGRQAVTGDEMDRGKFKTPSLRDVARTAPYMHDGSLATLKDVIEHYNQPGMFHPTRGLRLSAKEKQDLETFLREGLTSADYPHDVPPDTED